MKGPHFHNVQINLIHTLFTGDMLLLDEPDYERAVPVRISGGVSKCAPSFFMHKAPTFTSRGFVIT